MAYAYEGTWELVPELSHYDEGQPPLRARYVIAQQGAEVWMEVSWTSPGGVQNSLSFSGVPDGQRRPAGPKGGEASFHRVDAATLESRAYENGQQVATAWRRVSEDGALLSVVQRQTREGAPPLVRVQTYRRADEWGRG